MPKATGTITSITINGVEIDVKEDSTKIQLWESFSTDCLVAAGWLDAIASRDVLPFNTRSGVCMNFHSMAEHLIEPAYVAQMVRVLYELSKQYPDFSGNERYPIPCPGEFESATPVTLSRAERAQWIYNYYYQNRSTFWDPVDSYGCARLKYSKWMAWAFKELASGTL